MIPQNNQQRQQVWGTPVGSKVSFLPATVQTRTPVESHIQPAHPNSMTTALYTHFLTGTAVETGELKGMITDKHLTVIARCHLTDWESLVPFLGLTRARQQQIARSYPGDYSRQKQECLQVWREMKGAEATYQALITAAEEAENQLLADAVKDLCLSSSPAERSEIPTSRKDLSMVQRLVLIFLLFCSTTARATIAMYTSSPKLKLFNVSMYRVSSIINMYIHC